MHACDNSDNNNHHLWSKLTEQQDDYDESVRSEFRIHVGYVIILSKCYSMSTDGGLQ